MKNVIVYSRVSTDEQAQMGHSLDYQEETIIRHCTFKNYNVVKCFQEVYSAKDFERPEWKKILAFIKSSQKTSLAIDSIVILRPDRYSRNLILSFTETTKLAGLGCEVEFVEGQVDDTSPDALFSKAQAF